MKRLMPSLLLFIGALSAAAATPWAKDAPPGAVPEASDAVLVRRAYLGLAGRVPEPAAARAFVESTNSAKFAALVDSLLASDDFAAFWSMRFGDELRIKSEFPINLWPDACFLYTRRIRDFLARDEPYDRFARALLLARGSDFRCGEANFYRAVAVRDADHIADAVARFFLGTPLAGLPPAARRGLPDFFRGVRYKATKEWKEEIVYLEPPDRALRLVLPDGSSVEVPAGSDPRAAFADWLTGKGRGAFARATVARVHRGLFGATPPPGAVDALADAFIASGYDFRALVRAVCLSPAYRAAGYPVRRLGAEQLADSIARVTGTSFSYRSVIPEPFSVYPDGTRAADLPDGSVTDSFLLLFGRPSRDAGLAAERDDSVNAKRRLALANSADLFRRLRNLRPAGKTQDEKIASLYWMFYSRPPAPDELETARAFFKAEKWRQPQVHFAWILLNSKEFLYQH